MASWMALALWMSVNSSAVQATTFPPTFNHVRSEESWIRDRIAEGYSRSATFKHLVDATEALPCIVYISTIVRLSQGMRGALLHRSDGLRDMPVLRILVKTNLSRDEAIATIAHELRHVVEAMEGAPGGDGRAMAHMFATLDTTSTRGTRKYETEAAIEVTNKVRGELHAVGRDQREAGEPRGK